MIVYQRPRVCAEQCKHCLFGPDPVPGRKRARSWIRQLLNVSRRLGVATFYCHRWTDRGQNVICAGWWNQRHRFGWDPKLDATTFTRRVPLPHGLRFGETDAIIEEEPNRLNEFTFPITPHEETR